MEIRYRYFARPPLPYIKGLALKDGCLPYKECDLMTIILTGVTGYCYRRTIYLYLEHAYFLLTQLRTYFSLKSEDAY